MIARELEQGTLVIPFDSRVAAPARYLLVTTSSSRRKPQVRAFRNWILGEARRRTREGGLTVPAVISPFLQPPSDRAR